MSVDTLESKREGLGSSGFGKTTPPEDATDLAAENDAANNFHGEDFPGTGDE